MPVITPAYLYTFIALIAVSTLLVFSFMAYTDALRFTSEVKQLKNLIDNVAAKSTELITLTLITNASGEAYMQMPTRIGNKQYWLQFRNNSRQVWLEGGFGDTPVQGTSMQVYLPNETSATGYYVGGYGSAHIKCSLDAHTPKIQIESSGESE